MKLISRFTAVSAILAVSAPAFAHGNHADATIMQTAIHWLSQPVHSVPVIAVAALVGIVAYARRQRG